MITHFNERFGALYAEKWALRLLISPIFFLLKTGLDKKVGRASVVAVKRMPCKNVAMNFISKHNDTIPPNR